MSSTCPGSSPLARGLRVVVRPGSHVAGIIPARAGFTPDSARRCRSAADHPRSRGVYMSAEGVPSLLEGSSPLARGLLHDHTNGGHDSGIIPARAGFTGTHDAGQV